MVGPGRWAAGGVGTADGSFVSCRAEDNQTLCVAPPYLMLISLCGFTQSTYVHVMSGCAASLFDPAMPIAWKPLWRLSQPGPYHLPS